MMRMRLWVLGCALAFGQTFEVASIKPSPPVAPGQRVFFGPPRGGPGTPDPGQITWTYATMKSLIMTAYDVKAFQISGPAWMNTERYDIAVKLPAGTTKEQVGAMWRNLLGERFGMVVHQEAREFQVEELVVAKGGSKLKDTADDPNGPTPAGPPEMKDGNLSGPGQISAIFPGPMPRAHTVARAQPLSTLTTMLSNQLQHPVLDKTGLTGRYDYTLDYSLRGGPMMPLPPGPPGGPEPAADNGPEPDITAALQQQLGLRLVSAKATLDVVVVERVEKIPTEN